MSLLAEFRYPTTWYAKLAAAILALAFFALLANGTIGGFLLYHILSPGRSQAETLSGDFPGHPEALTFDVPGAGRRQGWFFPGLKTAPTILLCHGYESNRSELLTLVSALQDHQFNVFVFDFAAHGTSSGYSTMGYREAEELRAALAVIARRPDVDTSRFGIWGTNLGAYAAASVAAGDPRVRALVLDSVYNRPQDMVRLEVKRSGLAALPLMQDTVVVAFRWLNYRYRMQPALAGLLPRLGGVYKMFLSSAEEPELEKSTRDLWQLAPPPKELVELLHGNYAGMLDDEKRTYENRIVSFFLLNLAPAGRGRS